MDELDDLPLDCMFDEGSFLTRLEDAHKFLDYLIEDMLERYSDEQQ